MFTVTFYVTVPVAFLVVEHQFVAVKYYEIIIEIIIIARWSVRASQITLLQNILGISAKIPRKKYCVDRRYSQLHGGN